MPFVPKVAGPIRNYVTKKLNIGNITTNTTLETDVPWTGVTPNSLVFCIPPTGFEADLIIQNPCRCTANTVKLRIANVKTSDVDPAANQDFLFVEL